MMNKEFRPLLSPSHSDLSRAPERWLESALHCEWLETNGCGGYASSTVAGANTRRYHGLLISRSAGLQGPHVLLAKMDSSLILNSVEHSLSTNLYDEAVHPEGYRSIIAYSMNPHPISVYRVGDSIVRRAIMMPRGKDAVMIHHEVIEGVQPCLLRLHPLLAFRNAHALTHANSALCGHMSGKAGRFRIQPYKGMPDLHFETPPETEFVHHPDWFRNFDYPREAERGFDHQEDLFCPGFFEQPITLDVPSVVVISTSPFGRDPAKRWRRESRRRERLSQSHETEPEPIARLKISAEQFIVRKGRKGLTIIAGYPWFGSWGRDAMISVPGLCFHSGREKQGLKILRTFAGQARNGLIPNFLSEDGEHDYTSADASLWFAWAVGEWLRLGDRPKGTRRELFRLLERIITAIASGLAPGISVTDSGLLHTEARMTWMDAKIDDLPVTPRAGLAVEINALWVHALNVLLQLGEHRPKPWKKNIRRLRNAARDAFAPTFWLPDLEYLADVVTATGPDTSIRPNQLLAASLPISVLSDAQLAKVVCVVCRELSTPLGLRTLSPEDPAYRARYQGNPVQRDETYHQGTVWPWWIGHFTEARLLAAADPKAAASELADFYHPLLHEHLHAYGIGSIAEVFDGAEPQRPDGCIAQAWSVAETIRAWSLIQRARTTGTCHASSS